MEKLTQKWAIVTLLEPTQEGSQFYYTNFPLHVTLAGVFKTKNDGESLAKQLVGLMLGQKTFNISTCQKAFFGPNKDIAVMKINKTIELMKLYQKIYSWLKEAGAIFNESQYQGTGYLPHITYQRTGGVGEGETRQVKSVSIIDLFPNGDGCQRKIFKTVEFE